VLEFKDETAIVQGAASVIRCTSVVWAKLVVSIIIKHRLGKPVQVTETVG